MPFCCRKDLLWSLLWLWHSSLVVDSFVLQSHSKARNSLPTTSTNNGPLLMPFPARVSTRLDATVEEMRAEAERVRLEAELLEQRLTLSKIERLEQKLENKNWLAKHPEEEEDIERQLEALQRKLVVNPTTTTETIKVSQVPVADANANTTTNISNVRKAKVVSESDANGTKTLVSSLEPKSTPAVSSSSSDNPICGFDQADLEVYLPVARQIEADMGNSTMDEKLVAFRAAPDLQDYFQEKIRNIIIQPMEDMQKLEELRSQFLYTRSRVEKENLRRQITQMEKELEKGGPFGYSDSVFANVSPMSEEEMNQRLEAVGELPELLQALYCRRTKAPYGEIRLAILLDHYEEQLQLLEQIKFVEPLTDDVLNEATQAIDSLPQLVRDHVAQGSGLESGADTQTILNALKDQRKDAESTKEWSNMQEIVVAAGASGEETDDLDYIDRSRYAEEFYPSIARMEGQHPSPDDMDKFIREVVDRRAFMVQSKPERVVGGWYLRGENLLSDDEEGTKLVKFLMERLEASPELAQKMEFFYIPDPSPMSDEDFEMDNPPENVLYITGRNPATFYSNAGALTKAGVALLGFVGMGLFSLATVEMVPALQERLDSALTSGGDDLDWLVKTVTPVFSSLVFTYSLHELGHALIASRDNFKIGFGSPVLSLQTGFLGAITPLRSPPPSMKSLFDFAMAGPLFGFLASMAQFILGLQVTALVDMETSLDFPGLPVFLLRSSALCSALIEFFLGKGTLLSGVSLPADAVLPLHPFAIAGFVGLIVNSLALLPLGNTDGGRVSIAMFGRRGAYLISTFTAVLLCLVGVFGWDDSRIFLSYTLFALLWQRELETPARNEVEELDFGRGALGIFAALLVGLTLVPFF